MGKEFSPIVEAIEDVRQGKMIVIVDDEDRENEGDLMIAAEKATPELINFMARFGRGLICLTLTEERTKELGLSMMVEDNQSTFETPFTVSIDARQGVSTGISAADRAHTIKVAIDSLTVKEDLVKPGHIFPLRAKDGGVLVRMGQTEASVDIARIAGSLVRCLSRLCGGITSHQAHRRVPRFSLESNRCVELLITSAQSICVWRMTEL